MKYIILGAGPAGLSFARSLKDKGENDFLIIEQEAEAGGLCRSADVDGSPFDIGGGHFLDVRRPAVDEFLFRFMPKDEWDRYERDSKIVVGDNTINSPIEANIWQMKIDDQVEYLKSIAKAGCNTGSSMPERFTDWINWKLGDKIAEDYMIPYNQKMFGENLDELGTYWLDKLPDVSFEDTLRSCLEHRAYAKQPGHAEFFYPKKYGYGEIWKRIAESMPDKIVYNTKVESLDINNNIVNASYRADIIVTTIPWTSIKQIEGINDEVRKDIKALKHTAVVTEYHPEMLDTKAQWIYYPNPELDYHRILVRHNFCPNSKGYWTETNAIRFKDTGKISFINEYAYPLNTIGKQEAIGRVLEYMKEKNIYGLGRWGEWQHFNSDLVVERGMNLADKLA
ncbi:protoporphyrinogen/coproporphyrinogen oxidase [Lachnospiraceae bacterium C1.1]|nr:FAD-dependent oxidoreductase [Lachnospiraceae bacterium C1.1]